MKKILEDIRVLDLTHVVHGPWCTKMLASLGAEVIKIEPPWGALDRIPERGRLYGGTSAAFQYLNLNKKGMAIDLKNLKIVKIFKDLVKLSDVVVENFSPGTMKRLGIDYEELRKIKPDIIYASLSGFGQTGPYSSRGCYAPIAEAYSGHLRATGDRANPDGPPLNIAGAFGDVAPGTMAAMSIIAAIRYRDKTGKGQMIDESQLDCMVAYNYNDITTYFLSGLTEAERREESEAIARARIGGIMKAKDGWIQVAGIRARGLDALKKKLGVEELEQEDIIKLVGEMTRDEAVNFFVKVGLPVGPVLYASDATKDPHINARNMFTEIEHPRLGKIKVTNFPVKFSETPGELPSAAPLLGQHNREILKNILNYDDEEVDLLEKEGAITSERI